MKITLDLWQLKMVLWTKFCYIPNKKHSIFHANTQNLCYVRNYKDHPSSTSWHFEYLFFAFQYNKEIVFMPLTSEVKWNIENCDNYWGNFLFSLSEITKTIHRLHLGILAIYSLHFNVTQLSSLCPKVKWNIENRDNYRRNFRFSLCLCKHVCFCHNIAIKYANCSTSLVSI